MPLELFEEEEKAEGDDRAGAPLRRRLVDYRQW
jgi:hypothetical protein